jgi:phosphatidate cytidylyltransferase
MALHLQTFKKRTVTALVFAVVMLAGLLTHYWGFFILFSIIHMGCWVEYHKLMGFINSRYTTISSFHKYTAIIAGGCFMLYCTNDAFTISEIPLHSIGYWGGVVCIVLLLIELSLTKPVAIKNIGYTGLGLLYISLSWGLMISLRCSNLKWNIQTSRWIDNGYVIPAVLVFSIWINDTMAYLVGSFIGRTPLSSISPKKTWEGTVGGAILCVATMGLLGWYTKLYSVQEGITIAAIAAVVGTFGDLLESKLKRMAGVKDSGSFMPGHGGFLDRFDSLLLATPFVWWYVYGWM